MSDTVKVRITARQRVSYSQIKTIRRATFERYQQLIENGASDSEFHYLAELIIDPSDAIESDEYEDVEMRLVIGVVGGPTK